MSAWRSFVLVAAGVAIGASAVGVSSAGIGGSMLGQGGGSGVFRDETGHRFRIVAGTMRNAGSGWEMIENDRHVPLNLRVTPSSHGSVVLSYPHSCGVGSLLVAPDETLAAEGYSAGASVGADQATVRIARLGKPVSASALVSGIGNFWILGVFPVDDCPSVRPRVVESGGS